VADSFAFADGLPISKLHTGVRFLRTRNHAAHAVSGRGWLQKASESVVYGILAGRKPFVATLVATKRLGHEVRETGC
jgi:hypothetical protein